VGYPTRQEERAILDRMISGVPPQAQQVVTLEDIRAARELVREVRLDDSLKEYLIRLVFATREPENYHLESLRPLIAFGASPRATIYLAQAAKAYALLHGRGYVIPDDIKAIALDVLRHRIIVTYEAEAEEVSPEAIVDRVLRSVEVP
ncbi:MAG: MoxR family ATPase, partial [Chloroflexi bacterium]|nr:MoxR family ATPase [Chloroflexota bacterium]